MPATNHAQPVALRPATQRWMDEVLATYDLQPTEVMLLNRAACAWDMDLQAQALIARDGLLVPTRHGMKANPAIRISLENAALFTKIVKQLNFEEDVGTPVLGRPTDATKYADYKGHAKKN